MKDRNSQGILIDPADFDAAALIDAKQRMGMDQDNKDSDDTLSPLPTKFHTDDWTDDHFLFLQHLKSCKSSDNKRDLSYIVRQNMVITPTMSRADRLIQAAPLHGAHFDADNKIVYQKLRTWLSSHSTAMEHIRPFEVREDGRSAHIAPVQYFDGPGEISKQFAKSKKDYNSLFYKNENALPFANFIARLKKCQYIFVKASQPRNERTQVQDVYDKINTDNALLRTKLEVIRGDRAIIDNLDSTVNRIAEAVAEVFPNPSRGARRCYISQLGRSGRGLVRGRGNGNGGGGRGRGRNQNRNNFLSDAELANMPGGNPGDTWQGTDISDLTKTYPKNIFKSFPGWLKAKISKAKKGITFTRQTASVDTDLASVRTEVAALRAVMQASVANAQTATVLTPPPQNLVPPSDASTISTRDTQGAGTRFGSGAYGDSNKK